MMREVLNVEKCQMVHKLELKEWLRKYANRYASCTDRTFVKLSECTNYTVLDSHQVRAVFVVYDSTMSHIATVRIHNVKMAKSKEIDMPFTVPFKRARDARDFDTAARINAARYHIHRFIMESNGYVDETRKLSFYTKGIKDSLNALRKCNEKPKDKKRQVREGDGAQESGRSSTRKFCDWLKLVKASVFKRSPDVELPPNAVVPLSPEQVQDLEAIHAIPDDQVAGRNVAEALDKLELRSSLSRKRRELMTAMKPKKNDVVNVSSDVPCFHVVNSSVKKIEGYACVQIGGTIAAGFQGKYIHDISLAHLRTHVCAHVQMLKDRGVRNVLLSGSLWSASCRLSGEALNSDLPKWFDGMNVKFVANARYGKKIASQVRNHLCKLEAPENDTSLMCFDEVEDFEPYLVAIEEEWEEESHDLTDAWTRDPDLDLLQIVYNDAYPKSANSDQELKQIEFHSAPLNLPMPEIRMKLNVEEEYDDRVFQDNTYMLPTMDTHLERRHPVNQTELVYSVFNRNYMPAKEDSMIDSMAVASQLYDVFLSCLRRKPTPVDVSDADISSYIQRRGEMLVTELKRLMNEIPQEGSFWSALSKGTAKPELSDKDGVMSPTQVIIFKDQLYNVDFGPFLTKVKTLINRDLKDEVFIFSEDSVDGLQRKITRNKRLMRGGVTEVDISKYDKSQGLTSLLFDAFVFLGYGAPMEQVTKWVITHWYAHIQSVTGKTRFKLPAQRKSGDPWTYYGNTLYLLSVLKHSVQIQRGTINYIMVSGDDSLIWSDLNEAQKSNIATILARDFNLDAKLIRAKSLYFCSRFLIKYRGRLYLIPDPVKILIKMGKKDVRDRGHIEELRIALLDQLQSYRFLELRLLTEDVAIDRYNVAMLSEVMNNLYGFASSPENFDKLFTDNNLARRMAIIVPASTPLESSKQYVVHDDLVRKNIKAYDMPKLESYMRSVGQNCGKRILVTYSEKFVPQGVRVIANMEKFNCSVFTQLVRSNYRD